MNNFYDKSKCFVLATDGDLAPISIIEALCRNVTYCVATPVEQKIIYQKGKMVMFLKQII